MGAQDLELLTAGATQLNLSLTDVQLDQLNRYLELLQKWNRAYNLTAVRDRKQMIIKHLLDSLAVVPYVNDQPIIDVGSGAGLPGIPLAIVRPDLAVTTLDSNSKKTRFQNQVKIELGLENLRVIHGRVEQFEAEKFDQVISRAFASIEDMIELSHSLLSPQGIFLAMKGRYPDDELAALPTRYQLLRSHQLQVPYLDEERHLLVLGRA